MTQLPTPQASSFLEGVEVTDKLTVATHALTQKIEKSQKAIKDNTSAVIKFSAAMAGLAAVQSILVDMTLAIFNFGKEAVKAAIDAVEVANKFEVVFTDIGAAGEKFTQQMAAANAVLRDLQMNFGLAETTAKELLSTVGDLFAGLGLSVDESLRLSRAVVKLGGDLTSFQNIEDGVVEATARLTRGILGMTRNLRLLGITVRRNSKEVKSLIGFIQSTSDVSRKAAEAIAILALSFKESPKAINDFQRTVLEIAQQLRIMDEAFKAITIDFGMTIIRALKLKDIFISLNKAMKSLTKIWMGLSDATKEWIVLGAAAITVVLALGVVMTTLGLLMLGVSAAILLIGPQFAAIGAGILLLSAIIAGTFLLEMAAVIAVFGEGDTVAERFKNTLSGLVAVIEVVSMSIEGLGMFIDRVFTRVSLMISSLILFSKAASGFLGGPFGDKDFGVGALKEAIALMEAASNIPPADIFGDPSLAEAVTKKQLDAMKKAREAANKLSRQRRLAGKLAPAALEGTAGALRIINQQQTGTQRIDADLREIIQILLGLKQDVNNKFGLRPVTVGAGGAP